MIAFPAVKDAVFDTGIRPRDGAGVSVIVTLYNYAAYIVDALHSVHAQTHPRLELIVVNDASSDGSERIVRDWMDAHADRFERAVLLTHRRNYGLAVARNHAFEAARHPYVFVLDADNAIYPRAIARLLAACERSGAEAAYSQLERFGDVAETGAAYTWDPARLALSNYIDAMALIRRAAWETLGGFARFEVGGWEDYDMWCKFVEAGYTATFVPQILCRYRVHGPSMLRSETNVNVAGVVSEMLMRHAWLRL